jgi:hypothetical protein
MPPIKLSVRGLGHVPSFKNSKQWTGRKLITKPERQKWMAQCIRSFESQLRSTFLTGEKGMQTGLNRQSWIALSLPLDDSVSWIPEISVRVVRVPAGDEGADILIERV